MGQIIKSLVILPVCL